MKRTGSFKTKVTDEDWRALGLPDTPHIPNGKTHKELEELWNIGRAGVQTQIDKRIKEGTLAKGWRMVSYDGRYSRQAVCYGIVAKKNTSKS